MLTKKENFLIAAKGGKPKWVPHFITDINLYCPSVWDVDLETMTDWSGARWINDAAGLTCDTSNPPLSSVAEWREKVIFPDLSQVDFNKEISDFLSSEEFDQDKIIYILLDGGPSIFTRPIQTLGWEEGLAAHYEEPEELKAYIDAFTDFQIEMIDYICEYVQPDIIGTGDDFSFSQGPFIAKNIWDQFYKDNMKRIIDKIHSKGALAQYHNCGVNGYLLDETMDIGADIIELAVPNDDLLAAKEKYGNRLVMVGGWDRIGEASKDPDASEETVRQSVRDAIDLYGKDGALIFWDGGLIMSGETAEQKMAWISDEVEVYGKNYYK